MDLIYLLPFTYLFNTRLRGFSIAFHAVFEWFAAVVLVLAVGGTSPTRELASAGLSYLAFVCLYEIGYLVNDLYSSHKEEGGRRRGPQGAATGRVASWIASRIAVFLAVTILTDNTSSSQWWSFFGALSVVLVLHNALVDRELKTATFLWLAWFRFMAPVIFVVQASQLMGVALAAAMAYVTFRLLGYLSGKGMLQMVSRKRPGFRLFFFMMPLAGALALWPYHAAHGFFVLTGYFAVAAASGTAITSFSQK